MDTAPILRELDQIRVVLEKHSEKLDLITDSVTTLKVKSGMISSIIGFIMGIVGSILGK